MDMDEQWHAAFQAIRSLQRDNRRAENMIEALRRQLEITSDRAKRYATRIDELEAELERLSARAEVARRDVLRDQALRARLAKTDMTRSARLRTLRAALDAGIRLDTEQLAELRDGDLELAYDPAFEPRD
jgi:chromosome segregation ATPase